MRPEILVQPLCVDPAATTLEPWPSCKRRPLLGNKLLERIPPRCLFRPVVMVRTLASRPNIATGEVSSALVAQGRFPGIDLAKRIYGVLDGKPMSRCFGRSQPSAYGTLH